MRPPYTVLQGSKARRLIVLVAAFLMAGGILASPAAGQQSGSAEDAARAQETPTPQFDKAIFQDRLPSDQLAFLNNFAKAKSEKAMRDTTHIEEERRVLYVALTRAQDELIITRRDGNNRAANFSVSPESQNTAVAYFLSELPADLVE